MPQRFGNISQQVTLEPFGLRSESKQVRSIHGD
jgi:hypothetical protein